MHRVFKLVFPLLFLVASFAGAVEQPGVSATESGDLSLTIVASATPGYIEEWLQTPPEHAVTIRRLRQTKPYQPVVTAFIASGLTADSRGEYAFTVSFYVQDPQGKAILGSKDYAGSTGMLPNKALLIMADPALDIVFEKADPLGTYTIVAQLKDLVSGGKSNAIYKIELMQGDL